MNDTSPIARVLAVATIGHENDVHTKRAYRGRIRKAVDEFEDSLDRRVADLLTSSGSVGVLRGLKSRVHELTDEFVSAEERDVALRVLVKQPSIDCSDLVTVVRGILQAPER